MKIITGNATPELAQSIADHTFATLVPSNISTFADGEISVEFLENIRGEDVFIIQSTATPVNDSIMELMIMIDAAKRSSASRITAVIPYFGYARQDRKSASRTPITAKLVANLLTTAGADRVLTMDLHAGQIQGFFDIPTDNLFAAPVLTSNIKDKIKNKTPIIVSPDVGGVVRARIIASRIGADLAIVDKRREKAGESEVMNIIGDVEGRACFIIDDIVDSAGTLCNASNALLDQGATEVYAYVTHGVLSGEAVERVNNSSLTKLVLTDTIEESNLVLKSNKIEVISISSLLGEAIKRISDEKSVSSLFD